MKHIKLFESFIFEALGGLVTSKYDLDDFLNALDESVNDIYSSGYVRNKEAIFYLAKDGNINNQTHQNIIKCVISFDDRADSELYPGESTHGDISGRGYDKITVLLPLEKSSYNKILLDYTFIHEFSHSIDPYNQNATKPGNIVRRRDRIARKDGYKNFDYMFSDQASDGNKLLKAYLSEETEREAYPDGIAYIVRGLISKNPEKKEALKDLIRMNDWHIEKVFPELNVLINGGLKEFYEHSQYYRDKLIRRISELVINDLPTNLKKIAFITTYNEVNSITIKLLDTNNFKEILTRSHSNESSIIKYHQNFEEIVGNGLEIMPRWLYPLFKVKAEGKLDEWVCICFFDSVRRALTFKDKNLNWVGSGSDRFFENEIIVQKFRNNEHDMIKQNLNYLYGRWPDGYPSPSVRDIRDLYVDPMYRSKINLGVHNNAIINLGSKEELDKPMYKILSVKEE